MLNKSLNAILFTSLMLVSTVFSSCSSNKKKVVPVNNEMNQQMQGQEEDYNMPANTVYFDFDSSAVTSDAEKVVDTFIQYNKSNSIVITGHCDKRGTDAYNTALGFRRAEAVKKYIKNQSGCSDNEAVKNLNIQVTSKGKSELMFQGDDEKDHAGNRRAVIEVK